MNDKPKSQHGQVNNGCESEGAAAQRRAARVAHPTVSPHVCEPASTPINNMGVTVAETVELLMTDSGVVKELMIRKPAEGQCAVIDWVNFTVSENTWVHTARSGLVADDQFIEEASRHLEKIFGFGITQKRDRGMNFYRESWVLGEDFGFVCFGGQRGTMLITLNGQGCAHAISGWEKKLYDFLKHTAIRPVISRLDLAHDDFSGERISVDWAEAQYHAGGYVARSGGNAPEVERIGNWHRPRGKGRTFTVGLRTSGKFCRFYEKGKKEGDKSSLWCRCEVEFKACDRVIPFDALLDPSGYFNAAYPCFVQFTAVDTQQRMAVKRLTAEIVIDSSIKTTKHQYGKYLRVYRELYGDKAALDLVCYDKDDYFPKRMKPLTASTDSGGVPIHKQEKIPVMSWLDFISAAPQFGLNGENGFLRQTLEV